MPPEAELPAYALGHSHEELKRLIAQARLINPMTHRFMREAGIGDGMRVLDVGCGVGDVSFVAAGIVGERGEVIGTDRSGAALAVARRRAEEQSLSNVTFMEGDPGAMAFERPFDAVVGRYVLLFQPDPVALVRRVAAHACAGGVVLFHEPYRGGTRSYPPVPLYDRGWELVSEALRLLGADPLMGIKLHSTFLEAGLPAPSMRLESVIAGGASTEHVHFEMDLVATMVPQIERLGLATAAEIDAATLADRVLDEAAETESVIVGRADVGAWSTVP